MITELNENHFHSLIQMAEPILNQIENKAFFNWDAKSLLDEARIAKGLVFISEDEVQGFILYRQLADFFEIMVLATHPAHQKAGIMSALLGRLQQCAAQQGRFILLEVHIENKSASELYSKCGYKYQSQRKNYYKDGGACVLMRWEPSKP